MNYKLIIYHSIKGNPSSLRISFITLEEAKQYISEFISDYTFRYHLLLFSFDNGKKKLIFDINHLNL